MWPILLAPTVVALLATSADAPVLRDPQALTCEHWTTFRAAHVDAITQAVTGWMQGYFVGASDTVAALVSDVPADKGDHLRAGYAATSAMLDADRIPAWVDSYCAAHPTETIGVAALRMLKQAYGFGEM